MCTVSMLEGEARIAVLSVAHRDPRAERLLKRSAGVDLASTPVISRVVKTGRPRWSPRPARRQLRSFMSSEIGPYLDAFGLSSLVLVPMRANGARARLPRAWRASSAARATRRVGGGRRPAPRRRARPGADLERATAGSSLTRAGQPGAQRKPGFGTGLASFIRGGDAPGGV